MEGMAESIMKQFSLLFLLFILPVLYNGCKPSYTKEQKAYIASIEKLRADKNKEMQFEDGSPFRRDSSLAFEPLKYFDVDPVFVFKSKLHWYSTQDTVETQGTKGDKRKVVKIGYVLFPFESKTYKINIYKGVSKTGVTYFTIWFTDKTTGDETYGVGRYIDFELNPNPDFDYTIDFNLAYNPYCSYSKLYSCSMPTKEDYIDVAIKAGEKKFHH
jgi:uncharacterized protein (DUF1684 family)